MGVLSQYRSSTTIRSCGTASRNALKRGWVQNCRLFNLQSFSLVPEPGSFALLGLGVLALVLNFGWRMNMKQNSWIIV